MCFYMRAGKSTHPQILCCLLMAFGSRLLTSETKNCQQQGNVYLKYNYASKLKRKHRNAFVHTKTLTRFGTD